MLSRGGFQKVLVTIQARIADGKPYTGFAGRISIPPSLSRGSTYDAERESCRGSPQKMDGYRADWNRQDRIVIAQLGSLENATPCQEL